MSYIYIYFGGVEITVSFSTAFIFGKFVFSSALSYMYIGTFQAMLNYHIEFKISSLWNVKSNKFYSQIFWTLQKKQLKILCELSLQDYVFVERPFKLLVHTRQCSNLESVCSHNELFSYFDYKNCRCLSKFAVPCVPLKLLYYFQYTWEVTEM